MSIYLADRGCNNPQVEMRLQPQMYGSFFGLSFIDYFRWSYTSTLWPSQILSASMILSNLYSFECRRASMSDCFAVSLCKGSIRVLVVEDHHMVRQGLVALINVAGGLEVVGEAADGVEAIAQFRKLQPAVTLIDLRLPRQSGVEVIEHIRMETPNARFIVITTYDGDEDIYRALQAGARAYLLKGMTAEELIATIRTVHAGQSYIPQAIAEKLAKRVGTKELTLREFAVLEQIVHGKNNKEIAIELVISETTVKTHINRLLGKLGVTDRTQAATAALRRGLVPFESLRNPH